MRQILIVLMCVMFVSVGQQQPPPRTPTPTPGSDPDVKLPDGRSQRNAIAKEDYQKSLDDARELVKLAESLQSELEKNDQFVISVSEIRKTEDIEKLAKRIRGRLKRF
jgi:hypothetical protein